MDEQIKVNKFMLGEYSKIQLDDWQDSKKIVVYTDDEQARQFVVRSLTDKSYDKKLYFGYVLSDLAKTIKLKTGIESYKFNCCLSSNEIRKIIKDHGNQTLEALQGQRAVSIDDFLVFPNVVSSPDDIVLSEKKYAGKPVMRFIKNINGRHTVVTVKSDRHKELFMQTAYIGIQKGTLATVIDEQASTNTPEAQRGTGSPVSSILPQPEKNVNSLDEKSSEPKESHRETKREQYERLRDERARTEASKKTSKPSGKPPSGSGSGRGK